MLGPMLKSVDLSKETPKDEFKRVYPELETRLRRLQYACREAKVPVIVVLEGWDAAGKGTMISSILERLDPRGYKVHATHGPTLEERLRPFLWRFWLKLPNDGDWAIFDRSWYGRVFVERFEKFIPRKDWMRSFEEINQFERTLVENGTVLVKLFLHISKKEQKKRLQALSRDRYQRWKVEKKDLRNHKHYREWTKIYDDAFARTSTPHAPWTILEAEDRRFATVKTVETILAAVESRLKSLKTAAPAPALPRLRTNPRLILERVDLSRKLDPKDYKVQLAKYQARFRELTQKLYTRRIPCVLAFEGWDASGKGGSIKRLVAPLDPRAYDVIPISVPRGEEFTHHYLWRFWRHFPKAGHIAVFDRTWYGRIFIERVDKLTGDAWKRGYREIREMEEQMISYGTVLCKFWIHISKQEQLRRFKEREQIDHKRFKITPDDWHNRSKWNEYISVIGEGFLRTSTPAAPWTIVEGNDKKWARVKVLRTVCEAIEKRLRRA